MPQDKHKKNENTFFIGSSKNSFFLNIASILEKKKIKLGNII